MSRTAGSLPEVLSDFCSLLPRMRQLYWQHNDFGADAHAVIEIDDAKWGAGFNGLIRAKSA